VTWLRALIRTGRYYIPAEAVAGSILRSVEFLEGCLVDAGVGSMTNQ